MEEEPPQIELHTIIKNSVVHSIHIDGRSRDLTNKVDVLIDSYAYLNIIHRGVMQCLELHVIQTKCFRVIVVNRNAMIYHEACFNEPLLLDSLLMHANLYIIPFHEVDIVLHID